MKLTVLVVLLSFCLSSLTPSWAGTMGCFGNPLVFPTGISPRGVAVGDINGDGSPDFVIAYQGDCESGPGATTYLGRGDGTFQSQVIASSKADPYDIALADLNADGYADLLAAYGGCGGAGTDLEILLANGDGTFQPPHSYQAGHEPSRLAVGDFNNDGKLDVIVSDAYNGGQNLLLGNGDGTLQPKIRVPIIDNVFSSWDLAVADFNNDGNLDFVFAAYSAQIAVQLGNGDGTFGKHIVMPTQALNPTLTVGDINSDGNTDIVLVSGGIFTVLLGNGKGGFQKKASYAANREQSPVIADMGTDGIPDVVLADTITPPDVKILKGQGDGTFPIKALVPSGVGPEFVKVADFNKDGLLDIVGATVGYNGFGIVLLNTGQCH